MTKSKIGFIYLLQCDDNTFKIGATKNKPEQRVKKLNTGNPNKIILIDYYECEQYFKVEKMLHKKYNQNKTEGENEWRVLSEEQVNTFKEDCQNLCDNLNYVFNNNEFLK